MRLWAQIRYLGKRNGLSLLYFGLKRHHQQQREALKAFCKHVVVVEPSQKPVAAEIWKKVGLVPRVARWYAPEMEPTLDWFALAAVV